MFKKNKLNKMNPINDLKPLKLPNIFDSKYNNQNLYKKPTNKYFINLLKLSKIKKQNSENNSIDLKNSNENIKKLRKDNLSILSLSNKKVINSKSQSKTKRKKNVPNQNLLYSLKHFFIISNKNKLQKSSSYININTIEKDKGNLESNFKRLKNEANIYTANAKYIKNKKMVIIDKFSYDNNIYQPDRLGLFDMSDFRYPKKSIGKGLFGHMYFNHNKYRNYPQNINNK